MPKLPDKFALRGSSVPNARPAIVSIRGGQMARAVQGLGDDITRTGKIVEYEQKKKEAEEDDLNIARARSHFLTGKVNLESTLDDDADYENWDAKYAEKMGVLRNEAAALITNPKSRERFTLASSDDFARGVAFVRGRKKERQKEAGLGDLDTTIAGSIDSALKAGDEKTSASLLDAASQAIDGGVQRGWISPLEASKKKREIAQTYALSKFQTLPLAEQRRLLSGGAGGGDEASYRNNIGNLVVSGAAWQGKGAPFKGTFETFATPEEGVAANFKNIQAIAQKQGGSITLSKLASIWAPADNGKDPMLKGNDPVAWAKNVSAAAGIAPDAPLPLDSPEKMAAILRGINRQEHGKETVPAKAYLDGVRLARGEIKVASADPKAPLFTADPKAKGQIEPGNINLMNRPAVKNADGSVSSVRSMSVNIDGKEVLIPTVSDDGRIMSDDEAVAQFEKTGRHLGKFKTPEEASAYADTLHNQQASLSQPAKTGTIVDMIPMPQRIALKNRVEDEWERDQARQKREQRERLMELQASAKLASEDQLAAARETGRGVMPDDTFEAMIRSAYPEKADADRILKTYKDEKVFHGVRQDVALASPEEEAELLKGQVPKVDPSQPAGFYDDQVKRRDYLVQAIQAKRKALADDPAAFVMGNSPAVRDALTAAAESPAQMPAAVSRLREAQSRLGVPEWRQRVLTQGQAADIVGRISATSTDENRANVMEGLRQTYGPKNWPSVMRDLQAAKLPPELSVLGRLTGPGDAQPRVDLSAAFAVGRPALEKNLADTDKTTIKEALRSKTEELRTSLFAQGGGAEFEQQFDAAYMLSLQYIGKYNMSPREASAKAYDALIGGKWDFRDGYRTPKGQSREIGRGLDNIKAAISPAELMPAPSLAPGLTKDRIAEQTAYYAKRGTWVNNEDESGYILRYPNGSFVLRPDGARFEIGLKDAIDYKPKEDVTRPKSMPSLDIYPVKPR